MISSVGDFEVARAKACPNCYDIHNREVQYKVGRAIVKCGVCAFQAESYTRNEAIDLWNSICKPLFMEEHKLQ